MKAPYSWLKEYVDITLSPEELAERLTLAGLEVERVEYPWPNIITAQITWLQPVNGSDHLSATRVWTGREELSVVCGAPNIKLHDIVPLAQVGAKVGDIVIAEKKAMGVLSQGMLCSPRELGLSDDHAGIYILPKDTPVGVPFGKVAGEAVIDLDIKAHRADLFSVLGIAREIAAFTGNPLREPEISIKERGTAASKLMKLEVRDAAMCPRYSARVIRGIKIGPSPQWMADRLIAAGMRPINNVVDVTNYVMLELGQPLHAFDYDKVADHTIIVRRADPGETLTTLDGVERKLTPEMTLVTDPAGPNVIAGIFGGARVEVSDETTNLILEAAHWNPANIRRTSQALALRTEAGSRFEKNPDITLTTVALDRAAQIITQMGGGQVAPGYADFYAAKPVQRVIDFDLGQVSWLTNMTVTPTEAINALKTLGFGVEELPSDGSAVRLRVTVPTWRGDVEESADLVEEIARIVGYERIPSTIPSGPLPEPQDEPWFWREYEIRDLLLGGGLTEIQTYPLVSRTAMARVLPGLSAGEELLLSAPVPTGADGATSASVVVQPAAARPQAVERRRIEAVAEKLPAITLRNPLSADMEAMRLTLLPGLLSVTRENAKHSSAGLWFFEVGRRYLLTRELAEGAGLAEERRTVGVALSGPLAQSWLGERDADFFDIKGVAELLLHGLQITRYRFTQARHPSFHPGRCAVLEALALPAASGVDGSDGATTAVEAEGAWLALGVLGEVHPDVAERFDLARRTYLMELDLERLYAVAPARTMTRPISRYPVAQRDLAVVVARDLPEAEVVEAIRANRGPLTPQVQLFDVYTGEGIAPDKKSLAYTLTYRATDRTLTAQEVEEAQKSIIAMLGERFGAELRQ
ncbi:MAG TPA: phenylalanine--tRNA ligase subunit beta [Ktedonobacterales bacterium]|nr:phenylalanine--tRNA ligase subunit beta [Ktedonobacterales bacterium]